MKKTFQAMKRVLSLIMVFAMIVSFLPPMTLAAAETQTLYLKPNSNWVKDGARFAAYFFGNGETWRSMTDLDGDGIYAVEVPEGYPSVIFCRMNPGATANNWNNKWNQTSDLTVPTNDNNLYTVKDGTWDKGGGTWSFYKLTFTVAGVVDLCGTDWDVSNTDNDMLQTGDAVYQKVFTNVAAGTYEFKVVANHSWDKSWGNGSANASVTVADAGSTVTVSFDASTKKISTKVVKEYAVIFNGTNVVSNGASDVVKGKDYTAKLTAKEGYTLPETVTVTVGGAAVTPTYDATTGELTITGVAGDVVITAEGVAKEYDVIFEGENVTSNGATKATHGQPYAATLTPNAGYNLLETVTVTVGGSEITSHSFEAGVLTIPAASVAGKIVIIAEGVEIPPVKLYLKPNSNWTKDNARFAAYFFGNGETWVSMTDLNFDGVYEVVAPNGYPNVIFCRMNPNAAANNWDNKWNQTSDLTVPTDDKNLYTITAGSWDKGTWSVYTHIEPLFTVAGVAELCGTGWDVANTANDMTMNASGVYEKVFTNVAAGAYEFKVALNHSWDKSWGNGSNNATVTVSENGSTVTVTFDPATQTVAATVKSPTKHTVTFNGTNVTSNGAATVTEGSDYTATLTADEGYTLPETITVTGASAFDYNPESGELTIAASAINDNITITAVGIEEETGYTVYFINTAKWSAVAVHAWNEGGAGTTWPGSLMTKTADTVNGFDVYTHTFDTEYEKIIFNNNNNGSQTSDLELQVGQYYNLKDNTWYASLEDVPAVDSTTTDVYLAGSFNGWNTTVNEFKLNEAGSAVGYISLELEADTSYEFKVVKSGAWLGNNGTITETMTGWVFSGSEGNATIKTSVAGTYVFAFDVVANKLSVTYPVVLAEYTVTFNGTNVTSDGAQTVTEGNAYTATLTAAEGYTLPDAITVTVGGTTIDAYTYAEGILTIPAASITGDVVITAEGIEISTGPEMITIYFRNDWLWTNVSVHYFGSPTVADTAWPGMKMDKVDNDGTYDIYAAEIPADVEGIVFTGNKDTDPNALDQSPDIKSDITDGSAYYMHWDNENKCSKFDYTPSGGEGGEGGEDTSTEYEVTFHFINTLGWSNVYLYTWIGSGTALTGSWPGTTVNPDASGCYTATVTYEAQVNNGLNFIFNNGSAQTVDLIVPASEFVENKAEKWVVLTTQTNGKYNAAITDSPEGIVTSPVVDGSSVTFNFGDNSATSVSVAGTFNNWTPVAMTKDADGVWTLTVNDLSAGDYQYKFVVNGTDWVIDPMNGNIITETGGNQNSLFSILHDQSTEDDNKVTVRVHYLRADGNYENWNLWVWGSNMGGHQVDFAEELVDGAKVATIVLENARDHQDISFKQRKSVEGNDWADQGSKDLSIDLSTVVSGTIDYYIATENCVYGDDVIRKNKVSSVELDYDNNAVVVTFVQAISQPENVLKLFKGEEEIPVTITAVGSKYILALPADHQLNLAQLYQYKVNYYGEYAIAIDAAYASDKFAAEFTYTGNDLGASYTSSSTTFRVWAPTAEAVSVNLYTAGNGGNLSKTVPMFKDVNGTWVVTVEGNLNGTYYTYLVNVNGANVEACDPYARATGVNGKRAMVIDLDSTNPGNWDSHSGSNPNPVSTQTNAVIYELHVRDFSIDADSGVSAANRGKYLAFTEKGTKTPGGNKTGIDYLKSLGFTHLHLLPVYDFGSVDETTSNTFNWGYDPVNYNVPEGSYSTNPYNGAVRVNEFKQMVQALHDADISVVMDVVYNHVYDAEKFCFNQIVPGYFSRVSSNTSGCGNDTASEREMIRKYIVDSVLYWHKEYNIDGFRFDLVGLLDVETVNQIVEEVHDCCSGVIFYGEGWDMDSTNKEPGTEMAKQGNAYKTPGFAYFSDSMRNGIAGNNGTSTGFVSGAGNGAAMATEWMANPWWSKNPQQVVQYVSCHDNYTLADKLIISTRKSQIDDTVIKMNNLSAAFYMTAQGIPFIHAGEELLREKINSDGSRNHNSYNSSDAVNHIEWSNLDKADYAANAEYYKGLIEFRAAHKALRYGSATKVADNVQTYSASGNLIVMRVDGNGAGDDDIFVIFNAHTTAQTVQLPAGEWTININDQKAGTESLGTATGSVSVPAISAMVLTKADEGKDEAAPVGPSEEKTIYFSNNKHWGKVYAYAWTENGQKLLLGAWPGTEMTYVETNDYGEKIFSITLPASETGIEGLTISNGSGEQTVDIVPGVDGIGYYCTDKNNENKYEVGTYTYRAPVLGGADDYFLMGWINNADYLGGDYKFVDGKIVTTFANDSYVYVVNGDNTETYMTDGYQGAVMSATFKDTAKHQLTGDKWDKLLIPGGVEVTITMVKNSDHTVTLSYEMEIEAVKDTSGIQNGVTLHCWNWSFREIEENMALIADMGFTAIQTSPIQPLKEVTTDATDTVGGVWWVYYQPVDFKITDGAGNALGTKAELESMIETAHQYGIKVIVDVVANHLGNKTGNDLADAIPEYLRKDAYWHDISKNISSWDDRENMTQNCLDGLPDLNTANKELQGFVLEFLKDCVDIGVDGFRFDMAKSIETPMDNASFASDFWPTVVGGAEDYAKASCGKDLYIYGEILDDAKIAIGAYAQYMAVTDNGWGNHLRTMIAEDNATLVSGYYKSAPADALVIWAESHDTFASNASSGVSEADINKTWALVAARADAMGLYLARPESLTQLLGVASLTGWDNPEVEAVNEFHNAFIGQAEAIGNANGISYVVRGTTGAVLVNVSGNATVSVDALGMADGTYTDRITGNTFTVAEGKINGTIGSTGIAVVYNVPKYNVTVPSGVTADKATAEADETVTLTVNVPEGKEIESVTASDASGTAVTVTKQNDGTYTFEMPASAVTVQVTFKNAAPVPEEDNEVTVEESNSGTVEITNRNPETGAVVTITPHPDEGVKIESVNVTDKNGNAVTVTKNEDGTYSFIQPDGDVTVQVVFKPDYKFLSGNGGSVECGSEETLVFKVNGAHEKFKELKVDGEIVSDSDYTTKSGSTIITLKASFLKTLEAGEHDMLVIYSDGEVAGTFTLKEEETTAPSTDDEDEETTAPSTDDEDEETTVPSTGDEEEDTTAPSTDGEDEETTAPSTDDEDEETTAPSTDGEDQETTKPSSGNKDDEDTPPTGDESKVVLSTMAMTVSFLGLALLLLDKKRRFVK